MKETLCSVISDSLNELLNGEQEALDELISHGAQLFFDKSFIEVEDCVQKALSRKRSLDALSGVGRRWRELGDLDEFVRSCGLDLMTMAPDPTLSACNPDYRLRFATDMLMKVIIQIGARAFEACNFDQALKASKIAVKLQAFEKIINEICCEVEIVSTEKIESKLETMLLSKNADPVHC